MRDWVAPILLLALGCDTAADVVVSGTSMAEDKWKAAKQRQDGRKRAEEQERERENERAAEYARLSSPLLERLSELRKEKNALGWSTRDLNKRDAIKKETASIERELYNHRGRLRLLQ
jgi:hypothetical protein